MQRIFNYGSSLQGYALRRLLEQSAEDVQVSFVDYRAGDPLISPPLAGGEPAGRTARELAKLREYSAIDARFRDKLRFFNHKRTYARKYFPMIGIPFQRKDPVDLDLQVIGSDEVFNCVQANVNVGYSRDLFGYRSSAKHLISYAGSFGNTTLSKIEIAGIRDEVAADLSRFDAISVRDRNSQDIVAALTGTTPTLHLDPTLVYDFAKDRDRIPAGRQCSDKYIIVYGYSGRISDSENAAIRAHADDIGARVLAFGGLQSSADEYIDCDPFTLLAYFRDAEAVITDTFHGTIFSIINEVPFATIIRKSSGHGYGNEEKLGFLLDVLGLENRALVEADKLASLLAEPINFGPVRGVREHHRLSTETYLHDAMMAVSGVGA